MAITENLQQKALRKLHCQTISAFPTDSFQKASFPAATAQTNRPSAIFCFPLVILLYHQSFCYSELNYFALLNSAILLKWAQPFCWSELNHFVRHSHDFRSIILLQGTQLFCYSAQSFCDFVTVNSTILPSRFVILSNILLPWIQPFCYNGLNHFDIVLNHLVILSATLLQWTQALC
jgi:hypothetical protein